MTQKILFDTSFYIRSLRSGNVAILSELTSASARVFLSAVVLEELYAGVVDARSQKAISILEKRFEKVDRLVVPNQSDWSATGLTLSRIGRKYGYERIGKQKLTNDALLVMSAARLGLKLLTANARDFLILREFREFQFEII